MWLDPLDGSAGRARAAKLSVSCATSLPTSFISAQQDGISKARPNRHANATRTRGCKSPHAAVCSCIVVEAGPFLDQASTVGKIIISNERHVEQAKLNMANGK